MNITHKEINILLRLFGAVARVSRVELAVVLEATAPLILLANIVDLFSFLSLGLFLVGFRLTGRCWLSSPRAALL